MDPFAHCAKDRQTDSWKLLRKKEKMFEKWNVWWDQRQDKK